MLEVNGENVTVLYTYILLSLGHEYRPNLVILVEKEVHDNK